MELPMVTAYNNGVLASQILKPDCHCIKISISVLVICLNRKTMVPMNSESVRTCSTHQSGHMDVMHIPHEQKSCRANLYVQSITCTVPMHMHPLVLVEIKTVLHQVKQSDCSQSPKHTHSLAIKLI